VSDEPIPLSSFPYVRVRFACTSCRRRGDYKLARLAARFGPEIPLDELLVRLSWDCNRRDLAEKSPAKFGDTECGIYYVDLADNPPKPPDMPRLARVRLRAINGGKT
jgi:hypothetical protein